MKTKQLSCLLICLFIGAGHICATDLTVTTIIERVYNPDLPIYVTFKVMNTSTNPVWANSVGYGTTWVRPEVSMGTQSVEERYVRRVLWREDKFLLLPGTSMTGRLDIASFLATTYEGKEGLPPGEYRLTLNYFYGSNYTDLVKSTPQLFRVREPERELEKSRRDYQKMRQITDVSTNPVPASLIPAKMDTTNVYTVAIRVRYARWLLRMERFSESLSLWNDLLPMGDSAVTDSLGTKENIAWCYLRLKQPEKAKSILGEISNQSDSAFGILRLFGRRTTDKNAVTERGYNSE